MIKHILAALFFLTTTTVVAQPYQALDGIRAQVRQYIQARLDPGQKSEITVSALDRRLRLKQCPRALDIKPAYGQALSGKTTFAVKCPQSNWTLMVPASIDIYLPVYIARRPLSRGNTLQASDYTRVTRKVSLLPSGYIDNPAQLEGYRVKRPIRQGDIISPSAIALPNLVTRGQTVELIARTKNLVVRVKGEAMSDGVMNQAIRVRNNRSRRIVEGTVIDSATVLVNM